jgi:mono/diheme cytochrome c family protein
MPIGVVAVTIACGIPVPAQQPTTAPNEPTTDVGQLFASTCGYCHSDGGRSAGKGPKLMDSPRSDDFLRDRIKLGKEGAMPAFGEVFSEAQIDAILRYIRSLKPN